MSDLENRSDEEQTPRYGRLKSELRHEQSCLRVPTRSDTNRAVQPQKMARGLKFQIKEVEGEVISEEKPFGSDRIRT